MRFTILLGACSFALTGVVLAGSAFAAESTTYEYDALGRLVKSAKSGGPVSGTEKCTSYDAAGNRTNQTVNSSGCTASSGGGGSGGGGSPPPPPPSFAISNASASEGSVLSFTVTKSGTTSSSYSVSYATANGSAGGADYNTVSGTLTFAASETSKVISVFAASDTLFEGNEIFYVNLSSPTGGSTISDSQGVGTIFNVSSGGGGGWPGGPMCGGVPC